MKNRWGVSNSYNISGSEEKSALCIGLAGVLFAAGFLAPILGLIAIILHALIAGDTVFDRIGTALTIISIPLLLLSSHFLDMAERKK